MSDVSSDDEVECPVSDYTLKTKSKVMKVEYRWEIPNFINELRLDNWDWEQISGPVIRAGDSNLCWELGLFPASDGNLGIEIRQPKHSVIDSRLQMSLTVCIFDANNTDVLGCREIPNLFVPIGNGKRFSVVHRDTLLSDPARYLPDGQLTILCTLHYLPPETCMYAADEPEIVSSMRNLLADGRFSDIIVAADECEFPAHRAILAQRSDVFRAMFEVDMAENLTTA